LKIPLTNKNEIKIFTLYLMNRIGYPLDFSSLADIIIQDGIVNYFDFADCFGELIDTGNVVVERRDGKPDLYSTSDSGTFIAQQLEESIDADIRERSYFSAVRHLSLVKRGAELESNYTKREDGRYDVHCRVTEKKAVVYDITIVVESENEAQKIMYNFKKRSEVIYKGSLALLSGDVNYIFEP
jgi:hypothetical protein